MYFIQIGVGGRWSVYCRLLHPYSMTFVQTECLMSNVSSTSESVLFPTAALLFVLSELEACNLSFVWYTSDTAYTESREIKSTVNSFNNRENCLASHENNHGFKRVSSILLEVGVWRDERGTLCLFNTSIHGTQHKIERNKGLLLSLLSTSSPSQPR